MLIWPSLNKLFFFLINSEVNDHETRKDISSSLPQFDGGHDNTFIKKQSKKFVSKVSPKKCNKYAPLDVTTYTSPVKNVPGILIFKTYQPYWNRGN